METFLLDFGLPGAIIVGLSTALGLLWRKTEQLQKHNDESSEKFQTRIDALHKEYQIKIEDLLSKTIASELETRRILGTIVEGLSAQDLILKYLEKLRGKG